MTLLAQLIYTIIIVSIIAFAFSKFISIKCLIAKIGSIAFSTLIEII